MSEKEKTAVLIAKSKYIRNIESIVKNAGYMVSNIIHSQDQLIDEVIAKENKPRVFIVEISEDLGLEVIEGLKGLEDFEISIPAVFICESACKKTQKKLEEVKVVEFIEGDLTQQKMDFALKSIALKESYESKLGKIKKQSESDRKLIRLGDFAGNIVHDLATISTIVVHSMDAAKKEVQQIPFDKEKTLSHLERGRRAGDRIADISTRYKNLMVSGFEEEMEWVELFPAIEECFDLFKDKIISFGVHVLVDIPSEKKVFIYPSQFKQAVITLISNSIYAVKNHNEKWIRVTSSVKEDEFHINFIDSGKIISPDVAVKIFDDFYTTKLKEGTGFGLAASRRSLERQKANLYYSAEEKNTTFTISFEEKSVQ